MSEDYTGARVLAHIEHMGETFTIVRRRINGSTWRKYVVLLLNGEEMCSGGAETDPEKFKAEMVESFARTFPAGREDYFRTSIEAQKDRNARGVPLP